MNEPFVGTPEALDEAADLLSQWRAMPLGARLFFSVYLVLGSFSLYAGFLLTSELHHWLAWVVSLLVLEPIGVFCVVALGAFWAPRPVAVSFLRPTIGRARRAAVLVGVLWVLALVCLLGLVTWQVVNI